MQLPLRLHLAARPEVPLGILGASAVAALVFTATPFAIPAVAADFGVSLAWAASISTAQLAGFVLTSSRARLVVAPSGRTVRGALLTLAAANVVSAVVPWFGVLVGTRFVSGAALGVITWVAWTVAFGNARRMGDVAVVGPLVGVAGAPVVGLVADVGASTGIYAVLAAAALVPVVLPAGTGAVVPQVAGPPRHRPVRAAVGLMAALFVLTAGGSATFVYAAAIGTDRVGLGLTAVSLAFSLNALTGIPAARWRGRRRFGGAWMALTGVCAVALGSATTTGLFFGALAMWGFAFWMGVPATFALLAERSAFPEERAGDAQAAMAAGRVVGPVVGGVLVAGGSIPLLGLASGGLMVLAGATVAAVARWGRPPVGAAQALSRPARPAVSGATSAACAAGAEMEFS